MFYIQKEPNESGAYPAPQTEKAKGLIAMGEEYSEVFFSHNGFVTIEHDDIQVTSMIPNTEARETWKSTVEPEPEPEPEPTPMEDIMSMMIDQEYRLTMLELGLTE